MSATIERLPTAVAGPVARRFVDLIEDCCVRVQVAGSLRRRLATVGDIEVVAVPVMGERATDMFGDVTETYDRLDERLEQLLAAGTVQKRPRADGKTFWGPKAKYLTFEGVPVDLFTPERDRYGIILVIRTGPAQFSHRLVTPVNQQVCVGYRPNGRPILKPGLLPLIYRQVDGWLTYRVSGQRIPTPDEPTVFQLLGLPWTEPEDRQP